MDKYFKTANFTDVGRVRQVNEDFSGYFETPNGELFIMCDGMGGHVGGATASKLAVDHIRNFFQHTLVLPPQEALSQALVFANQQIIKHTLQDPELDGMGTTCVVVLLKDYSVFYAHAGDSRLYMLHNQQLTQLTKDHSEIQQLIDAGEISAEEAFSHPNRHIITHALGIEQDLLPEVCKNPVLLTDKDCLLLCTDGLTNMVSDSVIQQVMLENTLSEEKARKLIELANEGGGNDNISVQVIEIQQVQKPVIKSIFDEIPENSSQNPIFVTQNTLNKTPLPETDVPEKEIKTTFKEKQRINIEAEKTMKASENEPVSTQNAVNTNAKKSPDYALFVLIGLFIAVLIMFFSNWGTISDSPKPSELYAPPVDSIATTSDEPEENNTVLPNSQNQATTQTPDNTPKPQTPKAKKDTIITYSVKEGDNLTKISERFNLKKATIRKLNSMNNDELKAEQKLKIRVKAVHKVGPGDVLSKVSEKYGVSKDIIKKANEMTENMTTRGEKLIIPLVPAQ